MSRLLLLAWLLALPYWPNKHHRCHHKHRHRPKLVLRGTH